MKIGFMAVHSAKWILSDLFCLLFSDALCVWNKYILRLTHIFINVEYFVNSMLACGLAFYHDNDDMLTVVEQSHSVIRHP